MVHIFSLYGHSVCGGRVASGADNVHVALGPVDQEVSSLDAPTFRGAHEEVLVSAGDDVVRPTLSGPTHVLGLEVAAAGGGIAVDRYLMVGDDVLAGIKGRECGGDASDDRVDSVSFVAETGGGIRKKNLSQRFPLMGVDGPAVLDRQVDDGPTIGFNASGEIICAHTSVQPPSTLRFWPVT